LAAIAIPIANSDCKEFEVPIMKQKENLAFGNSGFGKFHFWTEIVSKTNQNKPIAIYTMQLQTLTPKMFNFEEFDQTPNVDYLHSFYLEDSVVALNSQNHIEMISKNDSV